MTMSEAGSVFVGRICRTSQREAVQLVPSSVAFNAGPCG